MGSSRSCADMRPVHVVCYSDLEKGPSFRAKPQLETRIRVGNRMFFRCQLAISAMQDRARTEDILPLSWILDLQLKWSQIFVDLSVGS